MPPSSGFRTPGPMVKRPFPYTERQGRFGRGVLDANTKALLLLGSRAPHRRAGVP
jgi:hypothetical protein